MYDSKARAEEDDDALAEPSVTREEILEAMYIQACYWSLGASLVIQDKPEFDDYVKKTAGLMLVQDTVQKPATIRKFIGAIRINLLTSYRACIPFES